MPTRPQYLTGRNVPTFSITPQTEAGDGTLADGTVQSLLGQWMSVNLSYNPETAEVSAADATNQNNVLLKNGWTLRLTVPVRKGTTTGLVNPLASLLSSPSNEVFKLILSRTSNLTSGAGTATWTYYGLKGGFEENLDKEPGTATATFLMVDTGAQNPAYPGGSGQP